MPVSCYLSFGIWILGQRISCVEGVKQGLGLVTFREKAMIFILEPSKEGM